MYKKVAAYTQPSQRYDKDGCTADSNSSSDTSDEDESSSILETSDAPITIRRNSTRQPKVSISRRNFNDIPPPTIRKQQHKENNINTNTFIKTIYNTQKTQDTEILHFDPENNQNVLHTVPSEQEIDSALLDMDQNNNSDLSIFRKTSDSAYARKYTSSSEISTLQSLIPPPPPPPPPPSNSLQLPLTASAAMAPSVCGESDHDATWNYPYSYCSSTVGDAFDEHKMVDNECIIIRPALINEMQATLQEMKIYETPSNTKQNALYTGPVSANPIPIDLNKQELNGPLLIFEEDDVFALAIQSIVVNLEIAAQTAFIEMNIIFINNYDAQIKNALFVLPTINGTVTNVCVCLHDHDRNRYIETLLVDDSDIDCDMDSDCNSDSESECDNIFSASFDEYIYDLFRFPIAYIGKNDSRIKICAKYHQSLEYNEGRYHSIIPLQFIQNILTNNVNLNAMIEINIILNSFYGSCITFGSNSHNLNIINTLNNCKQIHLNAKCLKHNIESKDIHIAYYYAQQNKINPVAFIQNNSFFIHINPISEQKHIKRSQIFARDIIFLIDRSQSMNGASHFNVIQALINAFDTLLLVSNDDRFGIVCFNETQIYFNGADPDLDGHENNTLPPKEPLFEVNRENIEAAKQFITTYDPRGGTDIVTPLVWSLKVLNNINNNEHRREGIPFCILITDGSDYQEKEIIRNMECQEYCKNVRILTFGIGLNINLYFLKLLSLKSRGWNMNAIYVKDIKYKLQSLISSCYAPILKDLCIQTSEDMVHNYENVPINDVILNNKPIIIYGRYKNVNSGNLQMKRNGVICICGVTANGQKKTYQIKINYDNNYFSIPLHRIYLKQELNELTAKYWYNENVENKKKIINLSVKENFPSEYVKMICFEYQNKNEKQKNNIAVIGVTNKLVGNPNIDHNLCTIFDSVAIGQFIDADMDKESSGTNTCYKMLALLSSCLCCACCKF